MDGRPLEAQGPDVPGADLVDADNGQVAPVRDRAVASIPTKRWRIAGLGKAPKESEPAKSRVRTDTAERGGAKMPLPHSQIMGALGRLLDAPYQPVSPQNINGLDTN